MCIYICIYVYVYIHGFYVGKRNSDFGKVLCIWLPGPLGEGSQWLWVAIPIFVFMRSLGPPKVGRAQVPIL